MGLDPFTIFAQVFNFLVLLLLLRRFLYGPIVRTMDERELRISREMDEAERRDREAAEQAAKLHDERQELENRRGELLTEAREDAEKLRGELIRDARLEVEERKSRWQAAIEREKETFLVSLRQRAGEQVYEISRRVLADLANLDLERHIIDTFISRLEKIEDTGLEPVTARFASLEPLPPEEQEEAPAEDEALLTSAFPVDEEARKRLAAAVRSRLGGQLHLVFAETPDLICGIELRTHGYKAAWSLQNYLETLDENLSLAFAHSQEDMQG